MNRTLAGTVAGLAGLVALGGGLLANAPAATADSSGWFNVYVPSGWNDYDTPVAVMKKSSFPSKKDHMAHYDVCQLDQSYVPNDTYGVTAKCGTYWEDWYGDWYYRDHFTY